MSYDINNNNSININNNSNNNSSSSNNNDLSHFNMVNSKKWSLQTVKQDF
jgi:hypothetical protein